MTPNIEEHCHHCDGKLVKEENFYKCKECGRTYREKSKKTGGIGAFSKLEEVVKN